MLKSSQQLQNNTCLKVSENQFGMNHFLLQDMMDMDILQWLQDEFANALGLASITVDLEGNPVTRPSNYTRFCMDYTHATEYGDKRCALSHRKGGEEAARLGKPVVYECHAGLIDFAVPIVLEGRQIGTILGGQVLTEAPDEQKYRELARKFGLDEEGYVQAACEVSKLPRERIEAAANILYIVANYMSKTAYYRQMLKMRSNLMSSSLNKISASVQALAGVTTEHHSHIIDLINSIEQTIAEEQKKMARLDKLNLIGEMAVNMGHEVRNPLTTVRGFLQYFSRKGEFRKYTSNLNIMLSELDQANDIITEFVALAKNRNVELKKKDLNQIILNYIPLFEADARLDKVAITLNLNDLPLLLVDEKEIRQLLLNLLKNAIDALAMGGEIVITTFLDDREAVLEIQDHGCGIPQEHLEKVGTPFFSTKPQGTGLGLAVCYRIAQTHSADLRIYSQEERGTKVRVIFNAISE